MEWSKVKCAVNGWAIMVGATRVGTVVQFASGFTLFSGPRPKEGKALVRDVNKEQVEQAIGRLIAGLAK